jgi:ribosomal protein S18 acetylase RimI-like enzyme
MLAGMTEPLTIRPTPPERQTAALDLLFANLSPAEKSAQMTLTLAAVRCRSVSTEGLLIAERAGRMVGAGCASSLGGKSALVCPPQMSAAEAETTCGELLHAIEDWMRSQQWTLATAYLTDGDSPEARRLSAAGYEQAAVVAYLLSESHDFPKHPPATRLEFVRFTEEQWLRLIAIVGATYIGTRDCPRLNGVRETRDVLEGYRTSGSFSPANWLIVRHADEDVGCLLLADHAKDNHMELVYMGVVPAARGRGLGTDITRQAQWLTSCAGRASLVLAVDAENSPALRGYAACGFREWERRRAFLKAI